MKNIIIALVISLLAGCTSPSLTVNNVTYPDYGLFNQDDNKDGNIRYEPNWWNIIIGIIFVEMIIPPIAVFGFHMMEPVGVKSREETISAP